MTVKSKFSEEFRRVLEESGLSMTKLSTMSGLSVGQLRNLREGICEPTSQTIFKLSEALHCSYDALFKASTIQK